MKRGRFLTPGPSLILVFLILLTGLTAEARSLEAFTHKPDGMELVCSDGVLHIKALSPYSIEVLFIEDNEVPFPSYAVADPDQSHPVRIRERRNGFLIDAGTLEVEVTTDPVQLHFLRNEDCNSSANPAGYVEGPTGPGFQLQNAG
jgi:hypothetical protein